MITIYYRTNIKASPKKVHSAMLDRQNYREWTKPFSPTSDVKGTWQDHSKMNFSSLDQDGNEAGMISIVDRNLPGEIVIIRHIGMFNQEGELFSGELIDQWKNVLEVYRFKENNGTTDLICSIEMSDNEDAHMFDKTWPEALEILKKICENNG